MTEKDHLSLQKRLESPLVRWSMLIYAAALALLGLGLEWGGLMLVTAGGSMYYLVAGLLVIASAVFVHRRDARGFWSYSALLLITLVWAFYEAGVTFWALVPRLDVVAVLGIPLLFSSVRKLFDAPSRRLRGWMPLVAGITGSIVIGVTLHASLMPHRVDPILRDRPFASAPAPLTQPLAAIAADDWEYYGGDAGATRFSPLKEITPANVKTLKLAWSLDSAPGMPEKSSPGLEVTPIVIGGTMYLCNAYDAVLSIDAETGQEHWRTPMSGTQGSGKPCRGVAYVKVPSVSGHCTERIIAASQIGMLVALDAKDGKFCTDFGELGHVSLRKGLSGQPETFYYVSSAPQIIRGNAVVGGAVKDDNFYGEPSGVIRAYDVVTGKLSWAFNAGRTTHNEPGPDQTYPASSPNSWAPISADESLGLVYMPMANAIPNYFNGYRKPEESDINSALVALDAETGEIRWRFHTVHDDLWDYDIPAQATLIDWPTPSGVRKALVQPTKSGELFVLDRTTGEPIQPVEEMPVPTSNAAPGLRVSSTQPHSTAMPTFRGPTLRESDMWGLTPIDQMICRIIFKQSSYEGPYMLPELHQWAIKQPGDAGGMEWGGVSIDIDRGIAIVNAISIPDHFKLITQAEGKEAGIPLFNGKGQGSTAAPMLNTPYAAYVKSLISPLGIPCNQPPWGTLSAVNLISGEVIWHQAFGTGRDSGPFGIRSHMPFRMGVPNIGGAVTTRGGIVFIGAASDSYLRAFETTTGKLLWEESLPGAGTATPLVYRSPKSGREFVVIAAGGKPGMQTRVSNRIVAYALPQ